MTSPVRFFFDPSCPWTWITSRWVAEVAGARSLEVRWEPYSLKLKNAGVEVSPEHRARYDRGFELLRVVVAVREAEGHAAVGDLYRALGTRFHNDGDEQVAPLADVLADAGLDPAFADAAKDPRHDDAIRRSTDEGRRLTGEDVGLPIIVPDGRDRAFSGPVLSPAPTGEEALALWDAYVALTAVDGLFEVKRTRVDKPQLPARP